MRTPDAENPVFWGLVKPTPKTRREGKAVCRRYETWAQSEVWMLWFHTGRRHIPVNLFKILFSYKP